MEKHGEIIRSDPVAHSFFYARLGHQYRRARRYADARKSFITALRIRPLSSTAWKGLVRTGLDRLLRR
jgi:cytochrome c-type biogenesis protein CcmH/NrfG